jgi:magnesium transporter
VNMSETCSLEFDQIIPYLDKENVNWLNIDGLHNVGLIEKAGKYFNLHPLNIEDILNSQHRPKLEEHDEYLFFTLKLISKVENDFIAYEHISLALGKNFVLTFQEKESELFNRLKDRLRGNGTARKRKADYLFYRLIDIIVDSYYIVLDNINDRIEILEDIVYTKPTRHTHREIQFLKQDLISLRKSIYPLREAVGKILKEEPEIIEKPTIRFFSDVYDHSIHIAETLDTFRDMAAGLSDAYVTTINYRMNEVIKVLTIISTIFMPLTFIVGVYGMNFDFMPELRWKWGYPAIMLLMLFIALGMVFYMKRKKWF